MTWSGGADWETRRWGDKERERERSKTVIVEGKHDRGFKDLPFQSFHQRFVPVVPIAWPI
jgi:hypothetical protein